ncbi:uncharacterized protein F4812DRAFT_455550 [Daldinia caldariorum]|uniref:uncharacterized protein n=1 Tax=Daldinia caldariorum TaxID=326644 RepID=UPI002008E0E5|nr:uncharacterized protein F4812DRAFT_455550 [Daldinia caldariorum]KAI1471439.1 hypothetical protein F4812DRAFT_455550 [Daldinia caldariorum]
MVNNLAVFICPPDFGSADGKHRYLERRRYGKKGYFAPEKFGAEWEHVAPTDPYGRGFSEQQVADNYTVSVAVHDKTRHGPRNRPSLIDLPTRAKRGTRKLLPDEDGDEV